MSRSTAAMAAAPMSRSRSCASFFRRPIRPGLTRPRAPPRGRRISHCRIRVGRVGRAPPARVSLAGEAAKSRSRTVRAKSQIFLVRDWRQAPSGPAFSGFQPRRGAEIASSPSGIAGEMRKAPTPNARGPAGLAGPRSIRSGTGYSAAPSASSFLAAFFFGAAFFLAGFSALSEPSASSSAISSSFDTVLSVTLIRPSM